ncbi:uroporphyrinogen-III synthase [Methanothermococcus okinawensis]|uniref:Uroporphyrinogen-III synthase n=1 Tax=Methanothermococcus okinawensis (strain DSM 14208 / JCM 11175 / IH1) TaxID=647113 RepID=F8AK32_METOI|nr:uroporphyrinogen-III synthase [Methanothermococcus okinawensis]AEH07398.1 Uroporphyrinogen-III synthase [Methanothermococcus okinawensis IH1]
MKVVITRPPEQGIEFANLLKENTNNNSNRNSNNDFEPILIPTLKLVFKDVSVDLDKYDWVVFTSPRGVLGLFNNLDKSDINKIKNKKIGVIGIKTAKEFKRIFGRDVDVMPNEYTADYLLKVLKEHINKDEKILIPTTPSARDILHKNLNADIIYVYSSEEPNNLKDKLKELKDIIIEEEKNNKKIILTFTSGLTAKNFFKNSDDELFNLLKNHYIVSIGPITNRIVEHYGFKGYIPNEYTVEGMIEVIKSLKNRH